MVFLTRRQNDLLCTAARARFAWYTRHRFLSISQISTKKSYIFEKGIQRGLASELWSKRRVSGEVESRVERYRDHCPAYLRNDEGGDQHAQAKDVKHIHVSKVHGMFR